MRFVYKTATSFDGWIADEHGSLDWLFAVDHAGVDDNASFLSGVGALVEGSSTYEWVLGTTEVLREPALWQTYFGDRPVFVFTHRTLPRPEGADVRFLTGSVSEHLGQLREAAGGRNVWIVGGGDLAGQFLDAGALDRVVLTVAPVALGAGAPLLPRRTEDAALELTQVERQGQFVELTYDVSARGVGADVVPDLL